jgi:hypothetical protein
MIIFSIFSILIMLFCSIVGLLRIVIAPKNETGIFVIQLDHLYFIFYEVIMAIIYFILIISFILISTLIILKKQNSTRVLHL